MIIILSFFFASISIYGQYGGKNIYEIGKPLDSCECNFENLFANFGPRFITNYDSIRLVSWEFVETFVDTTRINFYVDKIWAPGFVGFSASSSMRGYWDKETETQIRSYEFRIEPSPPIKIPQGMEREVEIEMRKLRPQFRELLQVGDKVFIIKLIYDDTEYIVDAYCRPGENKVFFDYAKFYEMEDLTRP